MFQARGQIFWRLEHLIQEVNLTISKLIDNYRGLHKTWEFICILKFRIPRLMFTCVVCYLPICEMQNRSMGEKIFM